MYTNDSDIIHTYKTSEYAVIGKLHLLPQCLQLEIFLPFDIIIDCLADIQNSAPRVNPIKRIQP